MRRPKAGRDGRPVTTSPTPFPHLAESRWPAAPHPARLLLRSACRFLSAYGWIWIGAVPAEPAADAVHEPPPGHPERLDGLPLTPLERALERELTG